jgi:hypothetical protein
MFQTAIQYTNLFITRPSKMYTNWDFGTKINHLATLVGERTRDLFNFVYFLVTRPLSHR